MTTLWDSIEDALCVYKSTRFIKIKNRKLAVIYYICITLVIIYISVYTIWYNKGYQRKDIVVGTSSAKLKGTGSVGGHIGSDEGIPLDAMDLVVPSQEENAFFITTSMIVTANQTHDSCPGNDDVPVCGPQNYTTVCQTGTYSWASQGIYTGKCCYSEGSAAQNECQSQYSGNDHCEVKSWCPAENDDKSLAQQIVNIGSFTAFVKVDIAFSMFGVSRSNTLDVNGNGSPSDGYNLFSLNEIIGNATHGAITNVSQNIIEHGAIILMQSQWDCDLDRDESECNPKWKFFRIDSEPGTMSYGYNYRTVDYNTDMSQRMLRKLYGIRVVFTTSGTGGKFNFAALTITFGAGLAYLGAAKLIADVVLEKFLPHSEVYSRLKIKTTDDDRIVQTSTSRSGSRYKNINNENGGGGNDYLVNLTTDGGAETAV